MVVHIGEVNPELSQKDVRQRSTPYGAPGEETAYMIWRVGMTDSMVLGLVKLDMVPTAEEAGGISITDFV